MGNANSGNKQQAPKVKYAGVDKMYDSKGWGFTQRSHEVEMAIMNGLSAQQGGPLKIMLVLTGCGENFRISESMIKERTGLSASGYRTARAKLEEMGWISKNVEGYITINMEKILMTCNSQNVNNPSQSKSDNTCNSQNIEEPEIGKKKEPYNSQNNKEPEIGKKVDTCNSQNVEELRDPTLDFYPQKRKNPAIENLTRLGL